MALFKPTYTDKKTDEKKESAVWWWRMTNRFFGSNRGSNAVCLAPSTGVY